MNYQSLLGYTILLELFLQSWLFLQWNRSTVPRSKYQHIEKFIQSATLYQPFFHLSMRKIKHLFYWIVPSLALTSLVLLQVSWMSSIHSLPLYSLEFLYILLQILLTPPSKFLRTLWDEYPNVNRNSSTNVSQKCQSFSK